MRDNLLVRVYDVGFGDCIYVGIPDQDRLFHILIDCGNTSRSDSEKALKMAVEDVRSLLRKANDGEERLDLLVVTHPHQDHIRGFDPAWFKGMRIGQIWLSTFMNEDHPEAKEARKLQALGIQTAKALQAEAHSLGLSASDLAILDLNITNPRALGALRVVTNDENETIAPHAQRLYVSRDQFSGLDDAALKKAGLNLKDGTMCLQSFHDSSTMLRVLAPEWDIDGSYLGETNIRNRALLAPTTACGDVASAHETAQPSLQPTNISFSDFRRLSARLLYSTLAFVKMDEQLRNNTSVVLLLEWQGRRLLFCGDAEWSGSAASEKSKKDSWNIMLEKDREHGHLAKPLDFLKVGHHGSINGSPYVVDGGSNQPILDLLLPAARPGHGQIVVSTEAGVHGVGNPVPNPRLLRELGRRAANARRYVDMTEDQPQRTDLEQYDQKLLVGYIDVELAPAR